MLKKKKKTKKTTELCSQSSKLMIILKSVVGFTVHPSGGLGQDPEPNNTNRILNRTFLGQYYEYRN